MPLINNRTQTKRRLIVFVKAPIAGEVKTRLMPNLSGQEAADLYRCFVIDLLNNLSKLSLTKLVVAYHPSAKKTDLSWTRIMPTPEFFKQEGKSLGERLIHAFGVAFGRGANQVVIMGSDSPSLPTVFVERAFDALEKADVVLGPALDGGYYLIGLSRPCLNLFDDVSWSTDQVFEMTSKNAQNQGYTLKSLAPHYDIDTIEDVQVLHRDLLRNPDQAPLTRKFLSQLHTLKPLYTLA